MYKYQWMRNVCGSYNTCRLCQWIPLFMKSMSYMTTREKKRKKKRKKNNNYVFNVDQFSWWVRLAFFHCASRPIFYQKVFATNLILPPFAPLRTPKTYYFKINHLPTQPIIGMCLTLSSKQQISIKKCHQKFLIEFKNQFCLQMNA